VREQEPGRCANQRPAVYGSGLLALDVVFSAQRPGSSWSAAGGTCGNVLAALSFLGWNSYPIARLNGDPASRRLQEDLSDCEVDLGLASQQPPAPTPIIVQVILRESDGNSRHKFLLACPECRRWLPRFRPITREGALDVIEKLGSASSALPSPKVFFFDRVSRSTLLLAKAFGELGALVVFEPSGVGQPELFEEAANVAHILKYSRERMPALSGRIFPRQGRLIEIETLGASGLRFRSRLRPTSAWRSLPAVEAPVMLDTAGAGDWCTAAFLLAVGSSGAKGLARASADAIEEGLHFAQGAAAVACAFEGARGLMKALSAEKLHWAVEALLSARAQVESGILREALTNPPRRSVCGEQGAARHRSPLHSVCPGCR
jgi:sugar/nucleoside kinase (ribokinase family)